MRSVHDALGQFGSRVTNAPSVGTGLTVCNKIHSTNFIEKRRVSLRVLRFVDVGLGRELHLRSVGSVKAWAPTTPVPCHYVCSFDCGQLVWFEVAVKIS
jgi:hypothetical protein